MTTPDRRGIVDSARTVNLADVGAPGYLAAVVVDLNGDERLVLVRRCDVGNFSSLFDDSCRDVEHEQLGQLPPQTIRRIAE